MRTWGLLCSFLGLFLLTTIVLIRLEQTKDEVVRNQQEILRRQAISITNQNRTILDLQAICQNQRTESARHGPHPYAVCPYAVGIPIEPLPHD